MRASPPTFLQGFICKANTVRPYNMPGRPSGESVPKTAVHPAVQEPDARQDGCGELPAAVRRYMSMDFSSYRASKASLGVMLSTSIFRRASAARTSDWSEKEICSVSGSSW